MAEIGRALLKSALARSVVGLEGARQVGSQLPGVAGTNAQAILEALQNLIQSKVDTGDPRLSNSRTPTTHSHNIGDLPVAPSGASDSTKLARSDDGRLSNSRTPTTHSHQIADLPVAASGESSTTQVVRADDSRLSNARTPASHAHQIADLPVAASGTSDTSKVARSDDSRLSDARQPTTHSHAIEALPVAASGASSTSQIVRADDSRLSNARTPTNHAHVVGDLPVAASGVSDSTKLARSDDSRLSNARTPSSHASSHAVGGSDALPQLHDRAHGFFSLDHSDVDTSDVRAHLDSIAWDANAGQYIHVAAGGVLDATEAQKGAVELATVSETKAGTDTTRAIHPSGLKSALSSVFATHIKGLEIEYSAADAIIVKSGSAWVPGADGVVDVPIEISATVASGTNLWRFIYLNANGTVSVLASTSPPDAPYKGSARAKNGSRYLGAVRMNESGNIHPFRGYSDSYGLLRYQTANNGASFRLINGGVAQSTTTVSAQTIVPPTSRRSQNYVFTTAAVLALSYAGAGDIILMNSSGLIANLELSSSQTFTYRNQGSGSTFVDVLGYEEAR